MRQRYGFGLWVQVWLLEAGSSPLHQAGQPEESVDSRHAAPAQVAVCQPAAEVVRARATA
jgi:hypothetical protein